MVGILGKPLLGQSAVETEFLRMEVVGWVGENPFQMECGSSIVNINHTETLNFHDISPSSTNLSITIPSQNNVDHCQNIHSQSDNRCFKQDHQRWRYQRRL